MECDKIISKGKRLRFLSFLFLFKDINVLKLLDRIPKIPLTS